MSVFNLTNNKGIHLQYDTSTSDILVDGASIVNTTTGLNLEYVPNRIYISMGMSCNLDCVYCYQEHLKKEVIDYNVLDSIIDKINATSMSDFMLGFWGGETLLYAEEINYILSKVTIVPKEISIVTNGILLTKSKKLIDKYGINIKMSYDGYKQLDNRGIDPVDKNYDYIQELIANDKFSILSVLTEDTLEFGKLKSWICAKLNVNDINIGGSPIPYNTFNPMHNLETMEDTIYNDITNGRGLEYFAYNSRISSFINGISSRRLLKDLPTRCGVDDSSRYIILSATGKELSCHNHTTKKEFYTIHNSAKKDKCYKCPVVHLCRGNCPLVSTDERLFEINCKHAFKLNSALLRAGVELALGNGIKITGITEN